MRRAVYAALAFIVLLFSNPIVIGDPHVIVHHRSYHRSPWHHIRLLVTEYVVRPSDGTCPVYTQRTASGTIARRGTVGVDPSVFRFGTRFLIPGYGYGAARDTGGAIIGYHIDAAVYSCSEAINWGVRYLTVLYR